MRQGISEDFRDSIHILVSRTAQLGVRKHNIRKPPKPFCIRAWELGQERHGTPETQTPSTQQTPQTLLPQPQHLIYRKAATPKKNTTPQIAIPKRPKQNSPHQVLTRSGRPSGEVSERVPGTNGRSSSSTSAAVVVLVASHGVMATAVATHGYSRPSDPSECATCSADRLSLVEGHSQVASLV